jgi:hypothetical protein
MQMHIGDELALKKQSDEENASRYARSFFFEIHFFSDLPLHEGCELREVGKSFALHRVKFTWTSFIVAPELPLLAWTPNITLKILQLLLCWREPRLCGALRPSFHDHTTTLYTLYTNVG